MVSSEDWTGTGSAYKLTHMAVGRIQSLKAIGLRLLSAPCQVVLSIRASM